VFDYPYPEIAAIVGKSQDNVRQLATRARRHVEQRRPRFQTSREQQDELATRFFAAAEQGDLAALEALLAHDVEFTGDGGGKAPALARPCAGAAVSRTRWSTGSAAAVSRACRCWRDQLQSNSHVVRRGRSGTRPRSA
jgi:RNA polymerase sigma-70 factor (ECF subfamily)